MYSVFLVDDEIVIREGIRNHVLWEENDFVLAGEAADGEIALTMLKDIRPDILLTDIRMPFMDGLELVKQAKESMPWLHVVILSGYDDFAYARQALALGVNDYLLKPVSGKELLDALRKVAVKIDAERRAQADVQALKEQFMANRQYLKEKAIQELFAPNLMEEAFVEMYTRTRKMGLTLQANCYTTLLVRLASAQGQRPNEAPVMAQLRRLAGISGGAYHFCECAGDAIMLVLGDGESDLDERAYGLAQTIRHELLSTLEEDVQISLGKTVTSLRDIAKSYAQALEISHATAKITPTAGKAKSILGIDDLPEPIGITLAQRDVLPIKEQLQYVTGVDIDAVLDRFLQSLGESALHSTMIINYIYVEVTLAASRIVRECGGDPKDVLPQHSDHVLLGMDTMAQAKPILREILAAAVGFRERCAQSRHDAIIRRAQAYLAAHYQDPDVSLKDVAAHVELSTNHFCTVFSQETGKTFTEYLTCMRLDKARDLLKNTAMRTSEIAYQVGYNDPHYFGYLFKRNLGINPRDFRKEAQEKDVP